MTATQPKHALTDSERTKLGDEAIARLFRDKTPPNGRIRHMHKSGRGVVP